MYIAVYVVGDRTGIVLRTKVSCKADVYFSYCRVGMLTASLQIQSLAMICSLYNLIKPMGIALR